MSRLVKYLFLFLLFLFPLGELFRLSIGSATIHATDIVLALLIPLWMFDSLRHSGKSDVKPDASRIGFWSRTAPQNDVQKAIIIFICVLILSLAIHIFEYPMHILASSFLYTIRFVCYALLYPMVFSFPKEFKKQILRILVVIGGIVVVLGYVQYFLYPDLRNLYYAGWDEHLYRMFSVFLDPNFAGAFFVCYFLLLLGVMPDLTDCHPGLDPGSHKNEIADRVRNDNERKHRMTGRVAYGLLSLVTLIAIALTYSRSAYIMLAVSVFVYIFLQKKMKIATHLTSLRINFLAMTVGVVALGLLFFLSPKSEGTNLLRTTSSFARLGAVQNAVSIWQDNVLFGVGFNAYRYAQEKHGFIKPKIIENHATGGTDNSFLFVLATTGIVGLVAYLYMWYKILRELLLHRHSGKSDVKSDASRIGFWSRTAPQNDVSCVVIATIVGLFVNALFVNSLFYGSILLWIFIELGLIDYT